MIIPTVFEQPYIFFLLIGIIFSTVLLFTCICIYFCVHRRRNRKQSEIEIAKKRLLYTSPASITPQIPTKATDRFVFPLPKIENTEIFPQYPINESSSNYKTLDLTKQYPRYL